MAVYSPGNPLGAKKDFEIMAGRAAESINSLPLVMKSQVGGYLFGSAFGGVEEQFSSSRGVKDASTRAKPVGAVQPASGAQQIRASRRGGSRKNRGGSRMPSTRRNRNHNRNRNRKEGGGIFGMETENSSSAEGFMAIKKHLPYSMQQSESKLPQLKTGGRRRTMRQGKGSAGSWAKAVTKYYKEQKKTRKALKFSDALKEAAKLKKTGKLMY